MTFLDGARDTVTPPHHAAGWGDHKWPVGATFWFVMSFGTFAWMAIIFACVEYL